MQLENMVRKGVAYRRCILWGLFDGGWTEKVTNRSHFKKRGYDRDAHSQKGGFLSAGNLKGSASPVCMPSIGGPHKFSYSDEYISTWNRKFATGLSSFF
jgi:hypothetical protein